MTSFMQQPRPTETQASGSLSGNTFGAAATEAQTLRISPSSEDLRTSERYRHSRAIVDDLLAQPELQRLAHVKSSATTHVVNYSDSPSIMESSIRTFGVASAVADRLGLPLDERSTLAAASLLRFVGTPAFGEHGAQVLHELNHHPSTTHEESARIVRDPHSPVYSILSRNGLDPLEVADLISPQYGKTSRTRLILEDVASRVSRIEASSSLFADDGCLRRLALNCRNDLLESLASKGTQLVFRSTEPVVMMMALDRIGLEHTTRSPQHVIGGRILREALSKSIESGRTTASEVRHMTDQDIVSRFPRDVRETLGKPLEQSLLLVEVKPSRSNTVTIEEGSRAAKLMEVALRETLRDDVTVCEFCPRDSWSIDIDLLDHNGEVRSCSIPTSISDHTFHVATRRTNDETKVFQTVNTIDRVLHELGIDSVTVS